MMSFDDIWPRFSWVLDEMKEGMCLFEGYIPALGRDGLEPPLSELIRRARVHGLSASVWAAGTSESDWQQEYTLARYLELFATGRIITLHFDYELEAEAVVLQQKLMFERDGATTSLEMVCHRDPILGSASPEAAVRDAIAELRHVFGLFAGDALFIGPDTCDYPVSATDYPAQWLRID